MTEFLKNPATLSETMPLQRLATQPASEHAPTQPMPAQPAPQPAAAAPTPGQATAEHTGGFVPNLQAFKPQAAPIGVSSNAKQFVVLVIDTSSSMSSSKLAEAQQAAQAIVNELANPENKDGFLVGMISFDSGSKVVNQPELATKIHLRSLSASGGTNFDSALKQIKTLIERFQGRPNREGWHYHKPHVLFLSDGQSGVSQRNIEAVHNLANVTAVAYGSDANASTLAQVATDAQVMTVGTNGGELRRVLESVGKTLSQTLQSAG